MSARTEPPGLRDGFGRDGYACVDALSPEEAARHRASITELQADRGTGDLNRWNLPHGVSLNRRFWPLMTHPGILAAAREALGTERIVYAEQSAIKVWSNSAASGWHRDSITSRPAPGGEWSADYRVVRVACYLQSADHGFSWGAVPRSHRGERDLPRWERALWRRLQPSPPIRIGSRLDHLSAEPEGRPWIRTGPSPRRWQAPAMPRWIPTEPTRCVLFDPRLIHAGGPVGGAKVAAFFALGADDHHTSEHRLRFAPEHNPRHAQLRQHLAEHGLSGA
jgi:hypothetical protein